MRYYSTRNKNDAVSFAKAALAGLAPDGGLYVPEEVPAYPASVVSSLASLSYPDIAFETIKPWVSGEIADSALGDMVHDAYPFDAPLVPVGGRFVLELFHGPTAAFKDFGARFMARAFSYLRRGENRPLKILVATSGDTGGAVADGFYGVEGITVTVLYPKGRVTPLQERQIAGLGGNVSAIAVEGSFDDCQSLVKQAFSDADLRKRLELSSANSINISRLIPQAVYYSYGAGQFVKIRSDLPFLRASTSLREVEPPCETLKYCVPSGNFGDLTAGLYAYKMGAPIAGFIAATNINRTVPDYLESGNYEARLSQATLSNAMDVGAPSNFERMAAHLSYDEMRSLIRGASITDDETRATIAEVHSRCGYFLDPHTAVGWAAVDKLMPSGAAILSTAHPAKFAETVEPLTGPVPVPDSIARALGRTVKSDTIPVDLEALKSLLEN